jgi:vacuole morphology and inheritance protein 14
MEKHHSAENGIVVPHPDDDSANAVQRRAFSLSRFIPLLSDRIYVVSPFTRSFLVSWISVLDSVPELELITYLPHLLDGLLYEVILILTPFLSYLPHRKYLSDPTEDVRIAAENQLAEFLREIREVTVVRKHREEEERLREAKPEEINWTEAEGTKERSSDMATSDPDRATFHSSNLPPSSETEKQNEDLELDMNERNLGGMFPLCALADTHPVQTGFPARVLESIMLQ